MSKGIVGDISPLKPSKNPEPLATSSGTPEKLGGAELLAATLETVPKGRCRSLVLESSR